MPDINQFKTAIRSGVTRQHRWNIIIGFPAQAASNETVRNANLLARTTTMPTSTIGVLDLVWSGRNIPLPGDRTFVDIPVTFLSVQDPAVLEAFETWSELINGSDSNASSVAPEDYWRDVKMQLLDEQDNVIKEYTLEDAWPLEIAGLEMDRGALDAFAEFTVTFKYLKSTTNTTR